MRKEIVTMACLLNIITLQREEGFIACGWSSVVSVNNGFLGLIPGVPKTVFTCRHVKAWKIWPLEREL